MKRDNALAQEQLLLMDRDARHIRNVGGVTEENLGKTTNAMAGVAIDKRQEQGSVVTAEIFDNLRLAVQMKRMRESLFGLLLLRRCGLALLVPGLG